MKPKFPLFGKSLLFTHLNWHKLPMFKTMEKTRASSLKLFTFILNGMNWIINGWNKDKIQHNCLCELVWLLIAKCLIYIEWNLRALNPYPERLLQTFLSHFLHCFLPIECTCRYPSALFENLLCWNGCSSKLLMYSLESI